ncbi:unnamed protein product, partial [Cyprideis torosa]
MLDVLHCILIDSPEALNMMTEEHIKVIISLLEKHGRDPKVLDVLCSLCVGNGFAVRSSQNNICDYLLPGRNLLLQTDLVDHVSSVQPNVMVARVEGSAMYQRWYYEVTVDHIEQRSHLKPYVRVGWANILGYVPYPGGGEKWGGNGVGDDLFSYGFDGENLWTGGEPTPVFFSNQEFPIQRGDVVGCALDLTFPRIFFTLNGKRVLGEFVDFNVDGMFFPVMSVSAKVSARFMFGGDQGRLMYAAPESFSPLVECLHPTKELLLEPSFHFGDLTKNVICGPSIIEEDAAFVPKPVDTSSVLLPHYVESIREKLAENIHELWAMRKIEQGWRYGDHRDDMNMRHPCLTTFEKLPLAEKQYDNTLALQTLKTILAIGYHISMDKPPSRIKTLHLPKDGFLQSNGYKPMPLDLSGVSLTSKLEELVELLAENTHNIWAKERISRGWTYGLTEDEYGNRSPHLVPYARLDDMIKSANRETAGELIRTLLVYGYILEPPAGGPASSSFSQDTRMYRAEKTYAVTSGKWYYEVEILTAGPMRVGWCCADMSPGISIGWDDRSWGYDGYNEEKGHAGSFESYGKQWQVGDVVGVMIDLVDRTISFSLNGELMMDAMGSETAFADVQGEAFVPAFSLGVAQRARLIFGQDINALRFFTACGLQEGYQPFCVNMKRNVTLWYNKDLAHFENIGESSKTLEVTRIPAGSDTPPCLKISHKLFETLEKANWEFLRLSLPITCQNSFIDESEKSRRWQEIRIRQHKLRAEYDSRPNPQLEQSLISSGFSMSDIKGLQGTGGYADDGMDMDDSIRRTQTGPMLEVPQFSPTKSSMVKTKSFDGEGKDASPSSSPKPGVKKMVRTMSEQHLSARDESNRSRAKASTPEAGSRKRTLSPFGFFKRLRDQSADRKRGKTPDRSIRVTDNAMLTGGMGLLGSVPLGGKKTGRGKDANQLSVPLSSSLPRRPSMARMAQQQPHGDTTEDIFDTYCLSLINEYFYGVRIFPGQDPTLVYVGWVNTQYHSHASVFNNDAVRRVIVNGYDRKPYERQNCWMVSAGELHQEVTQGDPNAPSASQGMFIGCTLDTATGYISFSCDGKPTRYRFRLQPGGKYFPAVFLEATSKEMLQVELGRTPDTLPISAAILQNSEKHAQPQFPPRLKIQVLRPFAWARVPNVSLKVHTLKLSDLRGWSLLCEDPVPMLALHIPEENRCIDILELIENEKLLSFHAHTLKLYCAVCYQSNYRASHTLVSHVNQRQLLYAIQSQYLSGPLRMGFCDLLNVLHLEPFAMTRDVPQDFKDLSSPEFDLETLKEFIIEAMSEAVEANQVHIRDPIGGSNEKLFVPLMKICDKLLLVGQMTDEDVMKILVMIDPETWDDSFEKAGKDEHRKGLLQMALAEGVKLELCNVLHHLCDIQLRHRVESLVAFSEGFSKRLKSDQIRRYIEVKQSDLPSSVAARKTREFRCPPIEQMNALLGFKNLEEEEKENCSLGDDLRECLSEFHGKMMAYVAIPEEGEGQESEDKAGESGQKSWYSKLTRIINAIRDHVEEVTEEKISREEIQEGPDFDDHFLVQDDPGGPSDGPSDVLAPAAPVRRRGRAPEGPPHDVCLQGGGEGGRGGAPGQALAGAVPPASADVTGGRGTAQETALHPDLMRILRIHENVMAIMINTLGRRSQAETESEMTTPTSGSAKKEPRRGDENSKFQDTSFEMVVACCRFLCYFCRSSRQNQKAMFEHLVFLLDNSNILLSRPSLRGSTPLDVAYSSLMDNTELALALREHYLEKIAVYLSRCGLQSNSELVSKGYPDIGWDPVEGERYLDFLRFCVWVSGETVEENANLVIRLLIRRPECLGPALRGEGEGLLVAIKNANAMSERISAQRKLIESGGLPPPGSIDHPLPESEEDEDYIDTGAAILSFYCTLVDLLGRCAPDAGILSHGKNDALRARAILRSLVPLEDLVGVLSLRFVLNHTRPGMETARSDMPPGLAPINKQSVVLFLERVYGIEEKDLFFRLLEEAFLPDLRAATMLDKVRIRLDKV